MGYSVRTTLAREITVGGVGLFTGAAARVRLIPCEEAIGVVFHRVDLPRDQAALAIPATARHVVPESRRTVLAADPEAARAAGVAGGPGAVARMATVQTVEHLLSALVGMGITDVRVEVAGPEVPIGDGSARLWVEAIRQAGAAELGAGDAVGPVVVREPLRVSEGGATVEALPLNDAERQMALDGSGPATEYTYHLDYSNFPIAALAAVACQRVPAQQASFATPMAASDASQLEYASQVGEARTFCLVEEAQAMRAAGLFAHVTPKDMLVIGDQGPIDNAWRFENPANEPARHKLLDLIGDLSLCGRPIVGRIIATRSGHALNQELARRLMDL